MNTRKQSGKPQNARPIIRPLVSATSASDLDDTLMEEVERVMKDQRRRYVQIKNISFFWSHNNFQSSQMESDKLPDFQAKTEFFAWHRQMPANFSARYKKQYALSETFPMMRSMSKSDGYFEISKVRPKFSIGHNLVKCRPILIFISFFLLI